MNKHAFFAMGCHMLAIIDANDEPAATRVAQTPEWFAVWEQHLSRFRTDSELSRLNRHAGQPMTVSSVLWDVLLEARHAAETSSGLVSPMVLAALTSSGYDRSFDLLDRDMPATVRHPAVPNWCSIAMNMADRSVTLPRGSSIDLGGVAKGWAATVAAQRLGAAGPALVDAGGDIAVSGPMADGSPWPIDIVSPFGEGESLGVLLLPFGGVATSGRDYRRWQQGDRQQHHIIDPRTGEPAQTDVLSATVVGPDCATAEMAAKTALILGARAGSDWLEARPALAGVLALESGVVIVSKRMGALLEDVPC